MANSPVPIPVAAPRGRVFFTSLALALTACGSGDQPAVPELSVSIAGVEVVAPPQGLQAARYPRLTALADGVLMSWLEPLTVDAGAFALRMAIYRDGKWQPTITVAEGADWFVNWADFPGIAATADGSELMAFWLRRNPVSDATYAYDVVYATSHDAGASWGVARRLHSDGTPTEHGFVSVASVPEGFRALWLDGRAMASDGPMSLRSALIDFSGAVSQQAVLDARTCECCKTAALPLGSLTIAAWRDRSEEEIRDIYVARGADSSWSEPVRVNADGWQIEGCPVNGPALASAGADAVGVAWFTLADSGPQVNVAFSTDRGANFGSPLTLAQGQGVLGRVAAAPATSQGPLAVSWLGPGEGGDSRVYLALAEAGGHASARALGDLPGGRQVGFPQLAALPDGLLAAWTNPALPGGLELRRIVIDD